MNDRTQVENFLSSLKCRPWKVPPGALAPFALPPAAIDQNKILPNKA